MASAKPYGAIYKLDILSATGTAILISALISIALLRMKPMTPPRTFAEVVLELEAPDLLDWHGAGVCLCRQLLRPVVHPGPGAGWHRRCSRSSAVPGLAGRVPDWFRTPRPTRCSARCKPPPHQIGVSDTLLVAANTTGGVTGKMISPQSIASGLRGCGPGGQGLICSSPSSTA